MLLRRQSRFFCWAFGNPRTDASLRRKRLRFNGWTRRTERKNKRKRPRLSNKANPIPSLRKSRRRTTNTEFRGPPIWPELCVSLPTHAIDASARVPYSENQVGHLTGAQI